MGFWETLENGAGQINNFSESHWWAFAIALCVIIIIVAYYMLKSAIG